MLPAGDLTEYKLADKVESGAKTLCNVVGDDKELESYGGTSLEGVIVLDGLTEAPIGLNELLEGDVTRLSRFTRIQMERRERVRKKLVKRKEHYKTRRKKRRERARRNREAERAWLRARNSPKGSWKMMVKDGWDISEEEWTGVVWDALGDRVYRIDSPLRGVGRNMANLRILDMYSGEILFDGAEYILKKYGYII